MWRLFQRHTTPTEHDEGSTWLELFFDLVYVAILVELGHRLSDDISLRGTVEYAFLFVPIWWSWLSLVFYTRYFPADDIGQRLLTAAYMGTMIWLAFAIHGIGSGTASLFILAYAATRFILALMYARAWVQYPASRTFTSRHGAVYVAVGLLWTVVAFVAPTSFWLWGAALAVDILAPLSLHWVRQWASKPSLPHLPVKHHYVQHRFGELTIIVLGEFFIKLITESSGHELGPFNLFLGACMLGISVGLWWLYFDHLGHVSLREKGTRAGLWVYVHYLLWSAITAYGVAGYKVFSAAPGEPIGQEVRLLFCIALAIAVSTLGLIEWASPEVEGSKARGHQLGIRLASAGLLLLLAWLGGTLGSGTLVLLVALVLALQVGLDIRARFRSGDVELARV